jgi:CHAT domain-containing protein
MGSLGTPAAAPQAVKTAGLAPVAATLALILGHSYLIEVEEHGSDVRAEVLDARGQMLARVDHPERRSGTQRAIVLAGAVPLAIRVTSQDSAASSGTAMVRAFDLAALADRPDCLALVKELAQADGDYAAGQQIARGHAGPAARSAREAFTRAAEEYSTVEGALAAPGDESLRGQTQLALAGIEYLDLDEWSKTAEWASKAAQTLAEVDPYRHARAEALAAAAWIEIARGAPAGRPVPGYGVIPSELLARARSSLRHVSRFHLARGERYDAGLQLTNIGLTYLYESRFQDCVMASATSGRLFDAIHETTRRAQAWQNQALCLWGLGRLPEARHWFERALADIGPEPYPSLYIGVLTNTALMDYALGHFDESLSRYDLALSFARNTQSPLDEAYCLYGIGVNYNALGDRERARSFLEQALAIQTVPLDGRGRMGSLRALAVVDAEQGRMDEAIALDREALALAVAHSSRQRITIQLAVHTAAAGHPEEARAQLDAVIANGAEPDPFIKAEALLQRAVVLRQMGRPREALADLAIAGAHLHELGSLSGEFDANLETARALRLLGQPDAARAAVERALGQADELRLQSVNPDLRAQLQEPLRAAYDLKIELLRARYEDAVTAGDQELARTLAVASFSTADASRARSFADVAAQEYPPALRETLAAQFRRREEIYRELAARRFTLESRIDRSGSTDARSKHLLSDIAELERQADAINTVINSRATARPGTHIAAAEKLPLLPADTVLVSYWLGSQSAYAWVVSPDAIHWARLTAASAIAGQAIALHRSLTRLVDVPLERRLQDAAAMYDSVVRPIESWLGAHQWVVIPDGALDYVPFAALRSSASGPGSFVAARHDVALTPAAWRLNPPAANPGTRAPRTLLIVADPVYQADDPRLAQLRSPAPAATSSQRDALSPNRDFQRLPYTAEEATGIAALFPPANVEQLLGVDATRARLLALDWSKYRFIHIATHGIVDAQVPELSALVLGTYDAAGQAVDGAVRVADLSLRTLTADVAVFSACDTALGKEVPSEGLVGISSTMLARGARAVVASLWPVSDEIGARLMTDFYRHLLRDSMSAPAALGAAMRSVALRDQSADPALWAGFQVSVVALGPGLPTHAAAAGKMATTTRPREMP